MDKVREAVSLIVGGRLVIEGSGRSFVKAPLWLAVLAGLSSLRLAAITALLVVAFGMKARIVKA